jgi:hypothetical protein
MKGNNYWDMAGIIVDLTDQLQANENVMVEVDDIRPYSLQE